MNWNSCFQLWLSILLLLFVVEVQAIPNTFNVIKFGARGDSKTDNTKAFHDTWREACQSTAPSMVLIPKGNYLVGPIVLSGPCRGPIIFHLLGNLLASSDEASLHIDHWISFQYLDRLTINGTGAFNGQGSSAWGNNTSSKNSNRKLLPISLRYDFVNNSGIHDVTFLDSKGFHLNLFQCDTITIDSVHIKAPGDSPNTDGIHVGVSNNIQILNSLIGTGDDCVSLGPGTKNTNINNVQCGPGHGISIGSLGAGPHEDGVIGVNVTNCNLTNTMYGARIKTFATPYQSTVSDITYDHINFNQVSNPIIIDQEYWEYNHLNEGSSGVKISGVRFSNMWGSSKTQTAVNLKCSQSNPCEKLDMRNINLEYQGTKQLVKSFCSNAYGVSYGQQHPPSCLISDSFST